MIDPVDTPAPRKRSPRFRLFRGRQASRSFLLVVLLLLADGGLALFNAHRLHSSAGWVQHTHQVLAELDGILLSLFNAESSQRGYILSGNPDHLTSYRAGVADVETRVTRLSEMTRDNPEQQRLAAELGKGVEARLDTLANVLKTREREGLAEASAKIRDGFGRDGMQRVRATADKMREVESGLLAARQRAAAWSFWSAVAANVVALSLVLAVFLIAWHEIQKELDARRRAELVAQQSSENFRVTLHSIGDAVIVTDEHGRVTMMNPVAEALTAWKSDEARGVDLHRVFHIVNESTDAVVESPVDKVLATGAIVGLANHTALVRRDGSRISIDDSGAPIRDASGAIQGVVLVFRDITEQKQAETQIRRRDERFHRVFEHGLVGMAIADMDGRLIDANDAYLDIIGYSRDNFRSSDLSWGDITPQEYFSLDSDAWTKLSNAGTIPPFTKEFVRSDGVRVPVLVSAALLSPGSGEAMMFVVDLSSVRKAEEALREREEQYRALTEATPQLIWLADADSGNLYCNQRWYDYTGLTAEQSRGDGWLIAVHPGQRQEVGRLCQKYYRGTEPFEMELALRNRDGSYLWHLVRGVPFYRKAASTQEWITLCTDIDEQKRNQQALQEADRKKDLFLATLAHELRNPLAPISNALEVWRIAPPDAAELDELRDMMSRQVQQMIRLIDDLLDLSRITRGKIQLRKERARLQTLVRSAVEMIRPTLERQGQTLAVELPDEPLWLMADETRVVQIFGNVLHNAVKYTGKGGHIEVRAERVGERVTVRFVDNGPGIPPHLLERIFGMFEQVDQTLDRAHGGLGIGLTLVRTLVEMHGGTVVAESDGLGSGSAFTITLPLCPAPEEAAAITPPASERGHAGVHLYVVDDVVASAKTLAMMLRALGHEVEVFHGGEAVLDAVKAKRPRAVFLDIAMPGMDGLEVARRLRLDHSSESLMLVALTGFGQEEDRRQAFAAGFDHHLVKPTSLATLKAVLTTLATASE